MPKLTQRIAQLEKAIHVIDSGVRCRLCYGHPVAHVYVMYERDPAGPGYRKTGDCFLAVEDGEHITDDLHCRACGAEALVLHLITMVGTDPSPQGRRVCGYGSE